MSFQTFVTERLVDITNKLNDITINAKKIFELPVQSTLDPTSKIHVSRGGTSESLEIQKIIDAIAQGNFSQLLSVGEISVTGLVISVPSGAQWVYENVNYATAAVTNIPTTLCATGFLRQDILVANQLNQIVLIKGAESETIRIRPNIPVGSVLVTEIDVDDTVVGTPSSPILFGNYIDKNSKGVVVINSANSVLLSAATGTLLYLNSGVTVFDFVAFNAGGQYTGKTIQIYNGQATAATITHNATVTSTQYPFLFPNEEDFVLNPKELIEFVMLADFSMQYNGVLNAIPAVEIADVTGLTAALAAKLDASAYNQYFKGKHTSSAALITAHPTATDGDYAIVDAGTGVDAKEWIWDNEAGWIVGGSTGASTTDALTEGSTNLYHTSARVLATLLSGLTASSGTFSSSDSLLTAFGKIKYLIDNIASTYQAILVSGTNIKTKGGISLLGSGDIPNSAKITTTVSITNATLTAAGDVQEGKIVKIDNGVNVINYTVNGALNASFIKGGTGAITFVQGSGRTLTGANGTLVLNGAVNSTASIVSDGTVDVVYINNL